MTIVPELAADNLCASVFTAGAAFLCQNLSSDEGRARAQLQARSMLQGLLTAIATPATSVPPAASAGISKQQGTDGTAAADAANDLTAATMATNRGGEAV